MNQEKLHFFGQQKVRNEAIRSMIKRNEGVMGLKKYLKI